MIQYFALHLDKLFFLFASTCAFFLTIVLQNKGLFPLDTVTFLFFSFVLFLGALYRPGWFFLFLIVVLPLEMVSVAPPTFGGWSIRPYQWFTVLLSLALALRFVVKRLPFRLFRPGCIDLFPVLIGAGSCLAILGAPVPFVATKQALILLSFVGIYFLGRIFFRTKYDVRQALPFFLVSSAVVFCYALWQNIRALMGRDGFQVMIGRPNATFAEADWLGLFALISLGIGYALTSFLLVRVKDQAHTKKNPVLFVETALLFVFLVLTFLALILSVARSAWLGAFFLTFSFFILLFLRRHFSLWKSRVRHGALLLGLSGSAFVLAGFLVFTLHLSPFQFLDRIQSTGSGLQKITLSCQGIVSLPIKIESLDELAGYDCRHIDLEERVNEKNAGKYVTEIYQNDPNVAIRQAIYQKAIVLIKEHALLGIGFGGSAFYFGSDGRGEALNASNIFLEVWLGSGLLGIGAFLLFLGCIFFATYQEYRNANSPEDSLFALTYLAILVGMVVFNLFNSGLLLGFFFIFLSIGALSVEQWYEKRSHQKNTYA